MNINLSNLTIGTKQQSGIMSVYPLLGEDVSTELANFDDIKFCGTHEYGIMVFENTCDKPFILPTGYAIMTKQQAQDHALTFATLLPPSNKTYIDTACCIEQTQCGYINGKTVKDFNILPLYIRKKHFEDYCSTDKNMFEFSFSRLWKIISSFQKELVNSREGNLIFFFNKFMDKLTQFNAEFEVVNKQRGAIIMLNDEIVGIEVVPTHKYWKRIWNSLIRDCYGSEVLRLVTLDLVKEFKKSEQLKLNISSAKTIEEIEKIIENYYKQETIKTKQILDKISNISYKKINSNHDALKTNQFENLHYDMFNKDNIYGEIYTDNNNLVYLSMLF